MKIILHLTLLLLVGITSCKTQSDLLKDSIHNFKRADFIGIVYDSQNRPCRGVAVQVMNEKKVYHSDIDGRFILPNLLKGSHTLMVSKEGFEPQEVALHFTSRKQILYVQLVSQEFLLDMCENMLSKLEWGKAENFLKRAKKIDADNSRFLALEGAFYYRTGQYNLALENWMTLFDKGHRDPYLFLMIADTYQYGLKNMGESVLWLKKYLKAREDDSVQLRLESIVGQIDE